MIKNTTALGCETDIMPRTLYEATLPQLKHLMHTWGQPTFRAHQLYKQLYVHLAEDAKTMTDLPSALRQRLMTEIQFASLTLKHVDTTDKGLTRKALFALPDGGAIETVLMVYPDRATVCVSTQAGCAIGCLFCATGKRGLQRNLSSGEMVEQVIWAAREVRQQTALSPLEQPISFNVVFMGMGEPFANYEQWWSAVERLHDPAGFNLGARHMTVSTVGIPSGINRLAQEDLQVNLAISLHAPDDELRNQLVPINRSYPIAECIEATRAYIDQTHRRVSFEYVLLKGWNDQLTHAYKLAQLLQTNWTSSQALLYHVNLIPWNPIVDSSFRRTEKQRVRDFKQVLLNNAIPCTIRMERGTKIAAACGQLVGMFSLPSAERLLSMTFQGISLPKNTRKKE